MTQTGKDMDSTGVTMQLAQFIAQHKYDSMSDSVKHEAKRAILNWVGCALGGSRSAPVDIAVSVLRDFGGPPQTTLINRAERFDAPHAALVNAVSSNMLDFDDTHLRTVIHPSIPVASAAIALAEHKQSSGSQLLHSFILGVETECRIGNAMSPEHYDAGWHVTATCGVLGAAAACSKLLGLDAYKTAHALSMAASQAGGLSDMLGGMTRMFNMGRVARDGMLSAIFASRGFTSSERGIESPRGYLNAFSVRRDIGEIIDGLGDSWQLEKNAYKPYPCGIVVHPVIDGCLELRAEHRIDPESIDSIELTVHPLVLKLTCNRDPRDELQGKLSVYHVVASAFIYGAVGVREFTEAVVLAPAIVKLRARVQATVNEELSKNSAIVVVRLKDGRCFSKHVVHAKGSVERPMTDEELEQKFIALANWGQCGEKAQRLADLLWSLDTAKDLSKITGAAGIS